MQRFKQIALGTTIFCGLTLGAGAALAQTAPVSPAPQEPVATSIDDVVVTARRREENVQTVPVAASAFGAETLSNRGVQSTTQLQTLVPGVIFTGAGSDANTTFTIRGQGKDVIGPGLPSVINYFNDVPMPSFGAVLPTFDVANIQVLKGPQGTLFGRNTTGGAVLVYSKRPTYEFEGYVEGTVGDYSWRGVEGAVNLPLIKDVLALRVAGNVQRRDGYTEVIGVGGDQDELHNDSFRASLLFEPNERFSNVTVFDYFNKDAAYASSVPIGAVAPGVAGYRTIPAQLIGGGNFLISTGVPALVAQGQGLLFTGNQINAAFNCGVSVNCDVDLATAQGIAAGPRTVYSDVDSLDATKIWGLSNTTTLDLGGVTIKNIFGYRRNEVHQLANTDGLALALLNTENFRNDQQFTEELQASGSAFNDKFTWLVGGFYLKSEALDDPNGLAIKILVTPIVGSLAGVNNTFYNDKSTAAFANFEYAITDRLSIDAGYRYTWDEPGVCSVTTASTFLPDVASCENAPGAFNETAEFSAPTWSFSIDYQFTPDIFGYAITRRGYRSGGLNSPLLSSTAPTPLAAYQSYAPQTVDDIEVGLKTNWTAGEARGRFNVAIFRGEYKDLQNQITGLPSNFDGDNNAANDPSSTTLVLNAGEARVQGVEVDGMISPISDLTLNFGVAYIDAEYTSFSVPPVFASISGGAPRFQNTPEWSYNLSGRYRVPLELNGTEIYLNADYYHVDDYTVGVSGVPAYGVANASIEFDNISSLNLKATVFVNNLTDEEYLRNNNLTANSPGVLTFGYGEPRMYGLRVRYNF